MDKLQKIRNISKLIKKYEKDIDFNKIIIRALEILHTLCKELKDNEYCKEIKKKLKIRNIKEETKKTKPEILKQMDKICNFIIKYENKNPDLLEIIKYSLELLKELRKECKCYNRGGNNKPLTDDELKKFTLSDNKEDIIKGVLYIILVKDKVNLIDDIDFNDYEKMIILILDYIKNEIKCFNLITDDINSLKEQIKPHFCELLFNGDHLNEIKEIYNSTDANEIRKIFFVFLIIEKVILNFTKIIKYDRNRIIETITDVNTTLFLGLLLIINIKYPDYKLTFDIYTPDIHLSYIIYKGNVSQLKECIKKIIDEETYNKYFINN